MKDPQLDRLDTIKNLGDRLNQHTKKIGELTEALKRENESKRELEEVTLPQLMDEIDLKAFELADGTKISVYDFVHARITPENQVEAFQYLRDTNNDGIIKNIVTIALDKGEDDRAEKLKDELTDLGFEFSHKQSVHASTLTAFVKEALTTAGIQDTIPKEVFGIYESRKIKIK